MAMWILGGVFAIVGLPFIWIARRAFARTRAIARWPRASGVVTSSHLEASTERYKEETNGLYYERTAYTPVVRYTYTVDGTVLEGTRVTRVDFRTTRDTAQACIDKYPPQKAVTVLYDPHDPKIAYLEVQRATGAVILFAFGCVWIAVGTLLLALSFLT